MGNQLSQIFPQQAPPLTESNIPNQTDRVFLVTGGYGGIGYHISRILFQAGGTVYIAGRDAEKGQKAIESIHASLDTNSEETHHHHPSTGKLEFLYLDLADLNTVKPAAEQFLRQEQRLDVLFHNAGVSMAPRGSVTKQGNELMMGTNCLGPWLLTHFLTPILVATATAKSTSTSSSDPPQIQQHHHPTNPPPPPPPQE